MNRIQNTVEIAEAQPCDYVVSSEEHSASTLRPHRDFLLYHPAASEDFTARFRCRRIKMNDEFVAVNSAGAPNDVELTAAGVSIVAAGYDSRRWLHWRP